MLYWKDRSRHRAKSGRRLSILLRQSGKFRLVISEYQGLVQVNVGR